jgi:hypothetical protein
VNTTDILRTLHGLAVEDRAWIIERLPARAKAQLLAMHPDESTPKEEVHEEQLERIPADIDAGRLAAVLADEPLWIAAVVLDGSTGPWVATVFERLPAGMRADIRSMHSAVGALTSHAKQTLIRSVLARVGCGEAEPTRSRFQSLLARLSASRSKKRLTIHL